VIGSVFGSHESVCYLLSMPHFRNLPVTSWPYDELTVFWTNKAYWTIRRQTNSRPVKSRTGQLSDYCSQLFLLRILCKSRKIIIYWYTKEKPNANHNPVNFW